MTFAAEFLHTPDLFPGRRSGESWGDRRIAVGTPGGPYVFSGLSADQEAGLRRRFGTLCREPGGAGIETRVFAVPASDFREVDTRGWEYNLSMDFSPGSVRFAGLRLMGRMDWVPSLKGGLWSPEGDGDLFAPVLENFFRVLTAYRLLETGGALLHSAAVAEGDGAFLLLGPSGAGKTTASRLCEERGGLVLSDDLNAVVPGSAGAWVEKLPFTGDLGDRTGGPVRVPLRAILRLEKGSGERLVPLSPARAFAHLLAASPFANRDPWREEALLGTLERLARSVPAYTLVFSLGGGLWDILRSIQP
ncbi:MAG TPA: hypothetical protein VLT87_20375 [Thermoanaerobaculia bacterium]|nr:hypothetical protein [Thermoanaerobaculia bacterium]